MEEEKRLLQYAIETSKNDDVGLTLDKTNVCDSSFSSISSTLMDQYDDEILRYAIELSQLQSRRASSNSDADYKQVADVLSDLKIPLTSQQKRMSYDARKNMEDILDNLNFFSLKYS